MKTKEKILKIAVFKRLLTENDEGYGVKLSIGNQSFKIDYYGDREEAQWMKDMLIQAINNLITKTREETIREVEGVLPKEKKLKEYEKTDPNVLTEANLRNLKVSFENQAIAPYVSAYNTVRQEVLDILNKLKK